MKNAIIYTPYMLLTFAFTGAALAQEAAVPECRLFARGRGADDNYKVFVRPLDFQKGIEIRAMNPAGGPTTEDPWYCKLGTQGTGQPILHQIDVTREVQQIARTSDAFVQGTRVIHLTQANGGLDGLWGNFRVNAPGYFPVGTTIVAIDSATNRVALSAPAMKSSTGTLAFQFEYDTAAGIGYPEDLDAQNPLVVFGADNSAPLFTNQTYRYALHAGSLVKTGTVNPKLRIRAFQPSSPGAVVASKILDLPTATNRDTMQSDDGWSDFADNGFEISDEFSISGQVVLETRLRLYDNGLQREVASTADQVLWIAQTAYATDYVFCVDVVASADVDMTPGNVDPLTRFPFAKLAGRNPFDGESESDAFYPCFALQFTAPSQWRSRLLEIPGFSGEPVPPQYYGKSWQEIERSLRDRLRQTLSLASQPPGFSILRETSTRANASDPWTKTAVPVGVIKSWDETHRRLVVGVSTPGQGFDSSTNSSREADMLVDGNQRIQILDATWANDESEQVLTLASEPSFVRIKPTVLGIEGILEQWDASSKRLILKLQETSTKFLTSHKLPGATATTTIVISSVVDWALPVVNPLPTSQKLTLSGHPPTNMRSVGQTLATADGRSAGVIMTAYSTTYRTVTVSVDPKHHPFAISDAIRGATAGTTVSVTAALETGQNQYFDALGVKDANKTPKYGKDYPTATELRASDDLDTFVTQMNSNPLALANYVQNEIRLVDALSSNDLGQTDETAIRCGGVTRSAHATFMEGQGNPWEQCSLLVYLLRKAGYPAYYAKPPGASLELLSNRASNMLRMQIRGAVYVGPDGVEHEVPSIVRADYPWVVALLPADPLSETTDLANPTSSAGFATLQFGQAATPPAANEFRWVYLFPWLKDTEIKEGFNVFDVMNPKDPTDALFNQWNSGYRWMMKYLKDPAAANVTAPFGSSGWSLWNLLPASEQSSALKYRDTTVARMFPLFVEKSLAQWRPQVSVDEIGVTYRDRIKNRADWEEFPRPLGIKLARSDGGAFVAENGEAFALASDAGASSTNFAALPTGVSGQNDLTGESGFAEPYRVLFRDLSEFNNGTPGNEQKLFDTIRLQISPAGNPARSVTSAELPLIELHNRLITMNFSVGKAATLNVRMESSGDANTTSLATAVSNTDPLLRFPAQLKTLRLTNIPKNSGVEMKVTVKRRYGFAYPAGAGDSGSLTRFLRVLSSRQYTQALSLNVGDYASFCISMGRVTPRMIDAGVREYERYRKAVGKVEKISEYRGTTARVTHLMGLRYLNAVAASNERLEQLLKVQTVSQMTFGFSKLGGKFNAKFGFYEPTYPVLDMASMDSTIAGSGQVRYDSGGREVLTRYQDFSFLSIIANSGLEHHTIHAFFDDPDSDAVSTVELLQRAFKSNKTNQFQDGFIALDRSNYLRTGVQSFTYGGKTKALKDWDPRLWKAVLRAFEVPGAPGLLRSDAQYVRVWITPGPIAGAKGKFNGMAALIIEPYGAGALIGNLSGGYGAAVNGPIFTALGDRSGYFTLGSSAVQVTGGTSFVGGTSIYSNASGTLGAYDILFGGGSGLSQGSGLVLSGGGVLTMGGSLAASYTGGSAGGWLLDLDATTFGLGTFAGSDLVLSSQNLWQMGLGQYTLEGSLGGMLDAGTLCSTVNYVTGGISTLVSHPVNVVTGEFYSDETDLTLPGPLPISLRRNYSSRNVMPGQFGPGWRPAYFPYLVVVKATGTEPAKLVAAEEDGTTVTYAQDPTSKRYVVRAVDNPLLTPDVDATKNLYRNFIQYGSSIYTLYGTDGSVRVYKNASYPVTARSGTVSRTRPYLTEWRDASGNKLTFTYGATKTPAWGEIERISSTNGSAIGFIYDQMGRIMEAYTTDGRRLFYRYDEYGDLREVRKPDGSWVKYDYLIDRYQPVASGEKAQDYSTHLIIFERKPGGRVLRNEYQTYKAGDLDEVGRTLTATSSISFSFGKGTRTLTAASGADLTGITVGMEVSGPGIPSGAFVVGVPATDKVTLSAKTTAAGSSQSLTFTSTKIGKVTHHRRVAKQFMTLGKQTTLNKDDPASESYDPVKQAVYTYTRAAAIGTPDNTVDSEYTTATGTNQLRTLSEKFRPSGTTEVADAYGRETKYWYQRGRLVAQKRNSQGGAPANEQVITAQEWFSHDLSYAAANDDTKGTPGGLKRMLAPDHSVTQYVYGAPGVANSVRRPVPGSVVGIKTAGTGTYNETTHAIDVTPASFDITGDGVDDRDDLHTTIAYYQDYSATGALNPDRGLPSRIVKPGGVVEEYTYSEFKPTLVERGILTGTTTTWISREAWAYVDKASVAIAANGIPARAAYGVPSTHTVGLTGTGGTADSAVTYFVYDSRGLPLSETSPLGVEFASGTASPVATTKARQQRYRCNDRGEVVELTLCTVTGTTTTTLLATHAITRFGYDEMGRKIWTERLDPVTRRQVGWEYTYYNLNGEVEWTDGSRADPEDFTYTRYDGMGHAIENVVWRTQARADGQEGVEAVPGLAGYATTRMEYNLFGDLIKATDALGNTKRMQYDNLGRTVFEQVYQGDWTGRVLARTRRNYDVRGRLIAEGTLAVKNASSDLFISNQAPESDDDSTVYLQTQYGYTDDGKKKRQTNPDGTVLEWRYDVRGRVVREPASPSTYWEISYDDIALTVTRTLKMEADYAAPSGQGMVEITQLDRRGNIISSTVKNGSAASAAETLVTTTVYDDLNRPIKVTPPAPAQGGSPITWTRYPETLAQAAPTTEILNALGEKTIAVVDALGRPSASRVLAADGSVVSQSSTAYDEKGHYVETWRGDQTASPQAGGFGDAAVHSRTYTDHAGKPVLSLVGGVVTARTRYDAVGNAVWAQDAQGRTTRSAFDALGRVSTTTPPGAGMIGGAGQHHFGYDLMGNVVRHTLPNGSAETQAYVVASGANLGKLASSTTTAPGADNRRSFSGYSYYSSGSAKGLLHQFTDPLGRTHTMEYDGWRRLTAHVVTAAGGELARRSQTYDFRGNVLDLQETNDALPQSGSGLAVSGRSSLISRSWDALSRQITERSLFDADTGDGTGSALVSALQNSYDAASRRTRLEVLPEVPSLSAGAGRARVFDWRADGLLSDVTVAGQGFHYTYGRNGLLQQRTNPFRVQNIAARNSRGQVESAQTVLPGGTGELFTEAMSYYSDARRAEYALQPAQLGYAGELRRWSYDIRGRLLEEDSRDAQGNAQSTSYTHDHEANPLVAASGMNVLTARHSSSGADVTVEDSSAALDAFGWVVQQQTNAEPRWLDANGTANGFYREMELFIAGGRSRLALLGPASPADMNANGDYAWAAGVRLEPGRHDLLARAQHPSGQFVAEMTQLMTLAHSPALTSQQYDAEGRITQRILSWSGLGLVRQQDLLWDVWGRLVQVRETDRANGGVANGGVTLLSSMTWTAWYDAAGRRLRVETAVSLSGPLNGHSGPAVTTETSWYDPAYEFLEIGVEVERRRAGLVVSAERTWKLHGPDLSGGYGGLMGIGGLEATLTEQTAEWVGIVDDNHGHVVGYVEGGTFSWTGQRYGAYGAQDGTHSPRLADGASVARASGWRGYRVDFTGWICMGARYYDPGSGRFLSPDPLGREASVSLFDYASGDPINLVDPTGRWGEAGHFWTTYSVAVIAGVPPEKAFRLAYYSQLPDERAYFDALSGWSTTGSVVPKVTNITDTQLAPAARAYLGAAAASTASYNGWVDNVGRNLHQLNGLTVEEVPLNQAALQSLVADGSRSDWERGFLIHAMGDSYAHLKRDGSAYVLPNGHGKDSVMGLCPDLINGSQFNYQRYVYALFDALDTGDGNKALLQMFIDDAMGSVPYNAELSTKENHEALNGALQKIVTGGGDWDLHWGDLPASMRGYNPARERPIWRLDNTERGLDSLLPVPAQSSVEHLLTEILHVRERAILGNPLGTNCTITK